MTNITNEYDGHLVLSGMRKILNVIRLAVQSTHTTVSHMSAVRELSNCRLFLHDSSRHEGAGQ